MTDVPPPAEIVVGLNVTVTPAGAPDDVRVNVVAFPAMVTVVNGWGNSPPDASTVLGDAEIVKSAAPHAAVATRTIPKMSQSLNAYLLSGLRNRLARYQPPAGADNYRAYSRASKCSRRCRHRVPLAHRFRLCSNFLG